MAKKRDKHGSPTVAPGIDNDEELEQKATSKEIEKGEYTNVTELKLDET